MRSLSLVARAMLLVSCATPPPSGPVTAYEGARLIVGDGRVIENGDAASWTARRSCRPAAPPTCACPPGATRVNLAGKTVMPMIIDTHVHLSPTREALMRDLKRRAYYGVSAAMSLGTDSYELLDMRSETIPGAARFLSAGRGITMPEPGRTTVPYWIDHEAEGRKAVQELAAHKVDIVKIWVDDRDGKYKKLTPGDLRRDHRRGAQARAARHRAHLRSRGREGADARRRRRASRTAFATRTSTTSWWRCSSSVRTWSSRRTCRRAA